MTRNTNRSVNNVEISFRSYREPRFFPVVCSAAFVWAVIFCLHRPSSADDQLSRKLTEKVRQAHIDNYSSFTTIVGSLKRTVRNSTVNDVELKQFKLPDGAEATTFEAPEIKIQTVFFIDGLKQHYDIFSPADVAMNDGENSPAGFTRSLTVSEDKTFEVVYRSKMAWIRRRNNGTSVPPIDPRNTPSLNNNFTFPELLEKIDQIQTTAVQSDQEELIMVDLKYERGTQTRWECSSKFGFLPVKCRVTRSDGKPSQDWKFNYDFVPKYEAYFPSSIDGRYYKKDSVGPDDWNQKTSIEISNCQFGIDVDPALFEFDAPKGFRVSDTPGHKIYISEGKRE